jgi:hypothetical protein
MEKDHALSTFNNAINAFYSSRLIIVDRTISAFLSEIVANSELFEVLTDCTRATNFQIEFNKAITRDGSGMSFVLPHNKRHLVALVTGLLFEFDKKSLSVVEFVTKFYPQDTSHASYMAFCDKIITPYAEAYRSMLATPNVVEEVIEEDTHVELLPEKASEDCDYWLRQMLDTIAGDNAMDERTRREGTTLVKGLLHVFESRNPLLIKLVWLGLKNTLGSYQSVLRALKEVQSVLINHGVIEP